MAEPSTNTPRITVVVPSYNYARFIADAVDGLLRQTFTEWEAIVIDDASTDDTAVVLERYDDPRVRIVRHDVNRGAIATYNEGIEMARGELLVLCSADDRYKPDFLRRVVDACDEHPEATIVTTGGDRIDEHGRKVGVRRAPFDRTGVFDALPYLFRRNFIAGSAGVARTEALRDLGGYDAAFYHSADAYLWFQLAIQGPLAYVHEPLYDRRMHSHMMSREIPKSELHLGEHAAHLTRIFSRPDLPPRVRAMRRLAYCELHYKTGVALYFEGHRARALVHLARATTLGPDVVARRRPIRALRRRSRGLPLDPGVFVHDTARCESSAVGAGTKVWAYAHVMDGARVGVECKIGDYVFIESGAVIGDRVTVKNGTLVWDHVVIDDDVFVGPGVVFTNDRVPRARNQKPADELAPTRVCEGASIGANSTIVCGTTIGRHAMVGAGSVVTRDVTAYALVMGNPAAQVGWVCECGERLGPELKCGCGRRYRALGVTLGEARSIEPDPD